LLTPKENLLLHQAIWAMLAGGFLISGYIPYMYALSQDDVSITAPLFQMTAPISYILGALFLHESLSLKQILAGTLIIIGAVLMTLNFEKLVWKGNIFKLMFFSCLLITLNTLVFKIIGLESSFWAVSLWEYIGSFVFGILLFLIPSYRESFRNLLIEGGKKIFILNVFSEILNVLGRLFSKFATLIAPIALISVVNGTQPFFIFIFGLFLFKFFPKAQSENFSKKSILVKMSAVALMVAGSTILFL
jgi:transporter family protein